jgi:hypothetical protein
LSFSIRLVYDVLLVIGTRAKRGRQFFVSHLAAVAQLVGGGCADAANYGAGRKSLPGFALLGVSRYSIYKQESKKIRKTVGFWPRMVIFPVQSSKETIGGTATRIARESLHDSPHMADAAAVNSGPGTSCLRGNLQPGGADLRAEQLAAASAHRRRHGAGRDSPLGSQPPGLPVLGGQALQRLKLRVSCLFITEVSRLFHKKYLCLSQKWIDKPVFGRL